MQTPAAIIDKLQRFVPLVAGGFFVLAVMIVHHQLLHYHITHIYHLLLSIPRVALAKATLLTAIGYLLLTFCDLTALRYLGKNPPPAKVMFAAFISFAISHNAGHALLSGTSMRYRFYAGGDVRGSDVLKITLLNSITYVLGLTTLFVLAYGLTSYAKTDVAMLPGLDYVAMLAVLVYAAFWISVLWWRPVFKVKGVSLALPGWSMTLAQLVLGCLDVIVSGMVLYLFISLALDVTLSEFFIAYVLALVFGNVSQVPGGLGVFEGTFIHMLSRHYAGAEILVSVVLYRIIYYFLPLGIAGILYVGYEFSARKRKRVPIAAH